MTYLDRPQSKNDVDIAYEILAAQGRPMYYYDIIKEVLDRKQIPLAPLRISEVLTQINLDARFNYVGKSVWGLRVWVPSKKGTGKLASIISVNKNIDITNEEDELFDEEVFDDDLETDDGSLEPNNKLDLKGAIY